MKPRTNLATVCLVTVLAASGCVNSAPTQIVGADEPGTWIVDEAGLPVSLAQAVLYQEGERVLVTSSNASGRLPIGDVQADRIDIWKPGYEIQTLDPGSLPTRITLVASETALANTADFLVFDEPIMLPCDDPVWQARQTGGERAMDFCGGGEPILEISSEGDIWVSTTVILASSPPIWVSRDKGESFTLFRGEGTGAVREVTGTEVDLAIDSAGNLYSFDENFAINWFTSWDPEGNHRWTHPLPMAPKTHDRPWVRARDANEVVIVYSDQHLKPRTSYFFRSADGGLTWSPTPEHEWPCAQMFGQGPTLDHLVLVGALGCDGEAGNLHFDDIHYRESRDFGKTWSDEELAPVPEGEFEYRAMWVIMNPVVDEAGNVYLAYTHATRPDAREIDIHLVRRDPEGVWHGPFRLGFNGTNMLPWISTGNAGHVGLSWYHTDAQSYREDQENATWHIMSAYSVDMDTDSPHFASAMVEPRPVFWGPGMFASGEGDQMALGREGNFLADFTASEFTPDGRLAVAYSRSDVNQHFFSDPHFAQSAKVLGLSPDVYWNGPR